MIGSYYLSTLDLLQLIRISRRIGNEVSTYIWEEYSLNEDCMTNIIERIKYTAQYKKNSLVLTSLTTIDHKDYLFIQIRKRV